MLQEECSRFSSEEFLNLIFKSRYFIETIQRLWVQQLGIPISHIIIYFNRQSKVVINMLDLFQ